MFIPFIPFAFTIALATPVHQTELGPLKAVKRSFEVNVADCERSFMYDRGLQMGQCTVNVITPVESDLLIKGSRKAYSFDGRQPLSKIIIILTAVPSGYTAQLTYSSYGSGGGSGGWNEDWLSYIRQAISQNHGERLEAIIYTTAE